MGAGGQVAQRVKWYRDYRDQGVQSFNRCRGSTGAEGQQVQRINRCRGSRSAGVRESRNAWGAGG